MISRSALLFATLLLAACQPPAPVTDAGPPIGLAEGMAPGECFDFANLDYATEAEANERLLACYPLGSDAKALIPYVASLGAKERTAFLPRYPWAFALTVTETADGRRHPRIRYVHFVFDEDGKVRRAAASCFDFESMDYANEQAGQAEFEECYPPGHQMDPIARRLDTMDQSRFILTKGRDPETCEAATLVHGAPDPEIMLGLTGRSHVLAFILDPEGRLVRSQFIETLTEKHIETHDGPFDLSTFFDGYAASAAVRREVGDPFNFTMGRDEIRRLMSDLDVAFVRESDDQMVFSYVEPVENDLRGWFLGLARSWQITWTFLDGARGIRIAGPGAVLLSVEVSEGVC